MKKVKNLVERYRIFIFIFLIVGIFVHLPLFTKNILTADVLLNTNYYDGYSWEISLGRFGLYIIGLLKGFYVFPQIEIFLSLCLLLTSTILLFELFSIKNKIVQIILGLVMVCSPIVSSTLLFHYCCFPYTLAFFFGISAIYLFYKSKKKIWKYLIPVFLISISLSMYQAYLAIPCTLILFYSIYQIFEKNFSVREFFISIGIILSGVVLYFILMKLSLFVFHIDMNGYRGASSFDIDTLLQIPSRIVTSYISFYQFYFTDRIVNNSNVGMFFFNFIFFLLFVIGVIYFIWSKHLSWKEILGIVILFLLVPLGICCVTVILPDTSLQLLMSSGFLLVFFFFGYLVQEKKVLYILSSLLLLFMIRGYLIQVEATYQKLDSTFQATYQVASNIYQDISKYDSDVVMIVGKVEAESSNSDSTYGFVANYPLFWDEYTNQKNGWSRFMKYYIGHSISYVDYETYRDILASEEYQDMNFYPKKNSIREIHDVLVVKVK